MKKIYCILFSLLVSLIAFSQTAPGIDWQIALGGTGADKAKCVKSTTDGGFIVVGRAASTDGDVIGNHGSQDDVWIVKLDKDGKKLWAKAYGGSDYDYGNYVQQTTDGGYIVLGAAFSKNGDVTGFHEGMDIWVLKLDSNGNLQWQKCYGGSDNDYGSSIQLTPDGGYVIAGYTSSYDGDVSDNHGAEDYWVIKITATGGIEWQKCYGGTYSEEANEIENTSDGGYIVAGQTNSANGDVTPKYRDESQSDYWIVKLSKNGSIEWQKCYGGSLNENCNSIKATKDGYILAGTTASNDGDVKGSHGNQDYWVVKLDISGNIVWQKCYGGSLYDFANAILPLKDGGFVIAGTSKSFNGDITTPYGEYDCWIIKTDSVGKLQWQKSIGASSYDEASSICTTNDLGYVIAGNSFSNIANTNYLTANYIVAKLKTDVLLPVSFTSFKGLLKNNIAYLTWQTASEQNSLNFVIQRNTGQGFENVGIVNANNNNNTSIKNYSFNDDLAGLSNPGAYVYYRLQQNDKNGEAKHSNIIRLQLNKANNLYIWPDPAKDNINAYVPNYQGKLQVVIYTVTGQTAQATTGIVSSNSTVTVNIANLPAATYFFTAIVNGKPYRYKFIKQ